MQSPKRGFVSTTLLDDPGREWQQALISGNGRMGAMVIGHPLDETIILSEEHLFLPLHKPLPPVHLAPHLDKIRQLLLDNKPLEASRLAVNQTYVERWGEKRWTDPLIPAFDLRANMSSKGPVRDYLRGVDFETGVASVEWMDNQSAFLRCLFVSRADDVVALAITSPTSARVNCRLSLAKHDARVEPSWYASVSEDAGNPEISAEDCWLSYRCGFRRSWPGSLQGYEGVARVVNRGGSTTYQGSTITIKDADEVIVLVRIGLLMDFTTSNIGDLKSVLEALNPDFDHLLERHARIHGEIINRVCLDLGGGEDRNLTSEELLGKSRAGHLNKALLEKEFDAGRYAILSSSGEWPPTLQGVWTGCWNPPWSSDYTLNGNVQAAIAIGLPGNMPEVLRSLFNYMRAFMTQYEENASRMYGCRGIHVPSRASSHGLNNHFDVVWPMCYWTAGAGWIARFYYDYWLYTGDRDFLEKECLPFMERAALFYEDFLVEGADGKYMFIPSYSPENDPGNSPNAACINATMDVAVARELLRNLIQVCEGENLRPEKAGLWKAMLAKLPAYMISPDGELKEWTWPTLDNNDKHRHASHLYPLYYTVDPEIAKSPELIEACRRAIESRLEFRRRQGGGDMAFGLFQLGIAASNLREAEMAYEAVDTLGRLYWHSSMGSTHNAHDLFNVDISGGMPALVIQMLANSEAGLVDILPALPKAWPTGRIEGIPLRGQILVESLAWEPGKATVALKSAKDQTVTLRLPAPIRDIRLVRGAAKIGGKHAQRDRREISLSAGQNIVLEICLE